MKAWVCDTFGPPSGLRLTDRPSRDPAAGEVRVAVDCAGVNFPDLLSIAGTYPIKSVPPFVPGVEGAGEIIACGDGVTHLRVGERVCWQDNTTKGGFAEEVTLPATGLARIPAYLPSAVAAAMPTVFGTAYYALSDRARLQAGETLVVHGASGGVGLACVQLGKLMGARVIATGSDDSKLNIVKTLGADNVVNVRTEPVRERILEITQQRGADVFCDPVGGELFDVSLRTIAPLGRLLVIGFTSGALPVAKANVLLIKAASVIGANYGHFLATRTEKARELVEMMLGWVAQGRLKPYIHQSFAFERCIDALEALAARRIVGKCVIINHGSQGLYEPADTPTRNPP
jgi:NADPH2:quinone reductase